MAGLDIKVFPFVLSGRHRGGGILSPPLPNVTRGRDKQSMETNKDLVDGILG